MIFKPARAAVEKREVDVFFVGMFFVGWETRTSMAHSVSTCSYGYRVEMHRQAH